MTDREGAEPGGRESLVHLLGGRKGALDASLPPAAFVIGWLVTGHSIGWGAAAAVVVSAVVGGVRAARGAKPRAVVVSLALVVAGAAVALYTGRAADFFLVQLLANVASALVWAASIALRWPLLGLVVGAVLGQRTRWRRDPALLRAYGLASWLWVGQYALRVAVFGPLWLAGLVVPLGIARVALSWPVQIVCIAASWWVLRRSLPTDHPGLRHPVRSGSDEQDGDLKDHPR